MAQSKKIKNVRSNQRTYLARDFDSLRAELTQYAKIYFSDQMTDFSENGVGGLLIEMAAFVGDTLSYYLDHQFNELDIQTAVESQNIEKLIRASGVKITGASPATATINFYLEAPAAYSNNEYVPDVIALPIVKAGTLLTSTSGVLFELGKDINFAETDAAASADNPLR